MNDFNNNAINSQQIEEFNKQGFLIFRQFIDKELFEDLEKQVFELTSNPIEPFELEVDVQYEGAPKSQKDIGGETVRRFLQMFDRHKSFQKWAKDAKIKQVLQALMQEQDICFVKPHHNSLMTKHPQFSSATNWHRDVRYWNYQKPSLISVWLAFKEENQGNGGLKLIPGSHNMEFEADAFDEKKFFRKDFSKNQAIISQSINVELNRSDVLFFHSRLLHAANANKFMQTKISLVNTYREAKNLPLLNTRSYEDEVINI